MDKLDMKKTVKVAYKAKKDPEFVIIPALKYVSFEGFGNPNTSEAFQHAMGVLYGMAYTIKFMLKEEDKDFTVMPLEGQWWSEDEQDFDENNKDEWLWKVMIALPDYITTEHFEEAKIRLKKKKNPPMLEKAMLETIEDGEAVQIMHVGSYSEEAPDITRLHKFAEDSGYKLCGKHREVYLSNPERTAQEKLKTILRHPVEKA